MHERRSGPFTGFAREQEILLLLREMPFASVSNLAARRKLAGISRATINHHLQSLYRRDYVGLIVRGWSQRAKRRYYLHSKGIDAVMAIANEPLEWGMTETALRRLLRQGQLLEMMYDTAPRLFSSNAVSVTWRLGFPLERLRWVSRGPIAALAEYQYDPCGDELVPRLMVPYVWYGNRPKPNPLPRDLTEWFSEITANPGAPTGTKIYFCGIVILAADRLSGMRSRKDLEPSRPRDLVTSGNACGGSLIEAMELIPSEGSISNAGVAPAHPGQPERIETEYIVQEPIQANVLGKTDHKVLTAVEEWPGCSTRQLARLCGHPPSKVRGTIDRFVKAGLMERNADGALYPTELILKLAEDRDRLGHRKTRVRAGAEWSPGGGRRAHMSRHESGVVELAIRFKRANISVAAGWRMVDHRGGYTQVSPDLWVLVPMHDGRSMWHAVEYERSATSQGAIERKLRPYRRALQMGEGQRVLMVCETETAAARFAALGPELPMSVSVYREVLESPFAGQASPWSYQGKAVDVDHLCRMPLWSREHRDRGEYLLVERTGMQL